ncbi:TetR/AcrR family transcriptional regulator [Marinigracilibium pacificum]|uniref:TetR/AcrR family transcriptional regulator n=1 Tax=Marinigracilibium pacificum TaxID=2729599 RepID=A0A848J1I8_9BACT|nr:TetR/AcrR family transcriptional regulator [Marinigracilibium pacificum]NMM48344.1 TetR/AcrR family transcriptional regulator [Marinigracilibium pacificum]
MKKRILDKAIELFTTYGFRAISMGKIARELGCSTKTLYQHYPNKTLIIKNMVEQGIELDKLFIENTDKEDILSIEKILKFKGFIHQRHLQNLYPGMTDDLKKYEPDIYALIETFFQNTLSVWLVKIIESGKSEGHFRENINSNILSKYLIELSMKSLSAKIYSHYELLAGKAYAELTENFIYGIASIKGVKFLNENFSKYFNTK